MLTKDDLEFNKFERTILSELIDFSFLIREICSNEFTCMTQIKNDGSIKVIGKWVDNYEEMNRTGWVCKICRDRAFVKDPIEHLLEHHHDLLIKKTQDYYPDYVKGDI